ncbi:MAG: Rne/Rng family ribonuclease [Betaproteobacteria bacterium]|nr:MAG: Rne/Rng family ribonuclease [Betaproteobacteria bacterium]
MKRMLFNATHAEELRVAIVDGQKLLDLDIETTGKEQRKSNIYKGIITRIEPSLEAAFVDYGADRHGFLPFKEISRSYFKKPEADPSRARIQDALSEGKELIVQVDKDERGSKGAALTTFISLAGRYLVLMPNNPRGGGVSRRIEGEERNELRETIAQLDIPQGMSIIARTAGIGRSVEELQWDLSYLLQLWRAIETAASQQSGAFLIYQDASLVIRAIRDYFHQDIGEILIDTESIYEQAHQFMGHVMPQNVNRVKLYKDDVPLFSRFQIEHQIETAYSRQVPLPSGGSVVIDHTEAMVAIDVNSARATKGSDIEETALRTNKEAADEIARQLRLRDLGGLVVIDFIDMESSKNQREVELRLRDALRYDRARVQTGKISRFGLLELSRQRLQTSLGETSHIACPRCSGTGHIRSTESTALHILRILQEEAMKENTAAIHVQVPVDVATYLLNEKRNEIHVVEQRLKINCLLIPNIHLQTPNYAITRLRHDELNQADITAPSYTLTEIPTEQVEEQPSGQKTEVERAPAAVKGVTPAEPAPAKRAKATAKRPSLLARIIAWLFGSGAKPAEKPRKADRRQRHGSRAAREERAGRARGGRDAQQEQRDRRRRRGKAGAETAEPREAQREAGRQRQQAAEGKKPSRRDQQRQAAKARADKAESAAIERRSPASKPEPEAEARSGRRRRRRGRGGDRRQEAQVSAAAASQATGAEATTEAEARQLPESQLPAEQQVAAATVSAKTTVSQPAPAAEVTEVAEQAAARSPEAAPGEAVSETEATLEETVQEEPVFEISAQPETPVSEPPASEQPAAERLAPSELASLQPESEPEAVEYEQSGYKLVQAEADELTLAEETSLAVEGAEETEVEEPEEPVTVSSPQSDQVQSRQVQTSTEERIIEEQIESTEEVEAAQPESGPAKETSADTAASANTGWRMEPVQLPSDMEMVETRPDAVVEETEPEAEPQAQRRPRRPLEEVAEPSADEPLIQIETGSSQPADRPDNP